MRHTFIITTSENPERLPASNPFFLDAGLVGCKKVPNKNRGWRQPSPTPGAVIPDQQIHQPMGESYRSIGNNRASGRNGTYLPAAADRQRRVQ